MILLRIIILSRSLIDKIYWFACLAAGSVGFLIIAGILTLLLLESIQFSAQAGILSLFGSADWLPDQSGKGSFGMLPMLVASLLLGLTGTMVAVPLALSLVIYRRLFASQYISLFMQSAIEVLAAIPSVVYGLIGLTVLVPFINFIHPPGSSLLAGSLILGLMIFPTAALIFDAGFERFSGEIFSSSAALGLSRTTLLISILLPALLPSIVTGAILGLARALGETMAVLMVTGNIVQYPDSIFEPVRAITANIALEMPYALGTHRSALFACGLVLTLLTVFVFVVSQALLSKHERSA